MLEYFKICATYIDDLLAFILLHLLELLGLLFELAGCEFEVHCNVRQIRLLLLVTHF